MTTLTPYGVLIERQLAYRAQLVEERRLYPQETAAIDRAIAECDRNIAAWRAAEEA